MRMLSPDVVVNSGGQGRQGRLGRCRWRIGECDVLGIQVDGGGTLVGLIRQEGIPLARAGRRLLVLGPGHVDVADGFRQGRETVERVHGDDGVAE